MARGRARALILGAVVVLLAVTGCAEAGPRPLAQTDSGPAFPRTAAVFLGQDELPPVDVLAAKDVVVIDSEWAHRLPRSFFTDLKARNPQLVLLAYVDLVDRPNQIGTRDYWSDRYALWQFDSPTHSTLPDAWLARTANGRAVSEYPGTTMTNLTDVGPKVDGKSFGDHAVDWMVSTVWAAGVWDGIYLDVWGDTIYTADAKAWDIDRSGRDVPDAAVYGAGKPWERGITAIEQELRARLPEAVVVANGERTIHPGNLNGIVFESFADQTLAGRDPAFDISRYLSISTDPGLRRPVIGITIDRSTSAGTPTADDRRRARFFLTATMLQNGYWASPGVDYSSLATYDELDGGGLGRGYLGAAVTADPTVAAVQGAYAHGIGQVLPGVYRRDFARGIVLCNTGSDTVTVPLGATFRRLRGAADPAVDDGTTATEVVLAPHDGIVLLTP